LANQAARNAARLLLDTTLSSSLISRPSVSAQPSSTISTTSATSSSTTTVSLAWPSIVGYAASFTLKNPGPSGFSAALCHTTSRSDGKQMEICRLGDEKVGTWKQRTESIAKVYSSFLHVPT
jgi:hypothetical protein